MVSQTATAPQRETSGSVQANTAKRLEPRTPRGQGGDVMLADSPLGGVRAVLMIPA